MIDPFKAANPRDPGSWPHDQSYANACRGCGATFAGPKRAPGCWRCVPEGTRTWWLDRHAAPKTLDEASKNPDGSYDGAKALKFVADAISPGNSITVEEIRAAFETAKAKRDAKK